ncbi:MAG: aspartate/glutamate racemase family protein [Rhizobiales bacterium]|nr:aspartate/glutamate racemase family protein [Hyphomicrobiales bacterium]
MRIHVINPNTTAAVTQKIAAAAQAVAAKGTEIVARQSKAGPESIEGFVDGAYSLPGLLSEVVAGEREGIDGHIIACFEDPGLDAARSLARAPVIGIGEAACLTASLIAGRFSIVTLSGISVPAIRHNIIRYGLGERCASVRAAEVPASALDDPKSDARERIATEIERAKAEDRAEAIVLGSAMLADLAGPLAKDHGLPVVEGISAAVKLVESLKALGLATSKAGGWAPPQPKGYLRGLGLAG